MVISLEQSALGKYCKAFEVAFVASRTAAITVVDGLARYTLAKPQPIPRLAPVIRTVEDFIEGFISTRINEVVGSFLCSLIQVVAGSMGDK